MSSGRRYKNDKDRADDSNKPGAVKTERDTHAVKRKRAGSTNGSKPEKKQKTEPEPEYEPFTYTEVNEYLCSTKKVPQERCQCSPGGTCGAECWNRILQIECTIGYCPGGDSCTNVRFQKRQYPKIEVISAGEKGNGLRVLEDLVSGQFVVEYVGEVIDVADCPERMKGRRHFYFLSIDGQTGIDASRRGNLARFINHSCDPNCATQKWTVGGRTKVGIFALRDIPAGTELTFDYKFERIGCAKQRCLCGSANCRGWLGAKPVDEDDKKKVRATFSNHNRYSQHLFSRIDLEEIDEVIKEEIPYMMAKNNAKRGTKIFLNRSLRSQKLRHAMELHKMVLGAYDKELEEFEQHEERLREKQSTSSLLFMDAEKTAKTGFLYFDPTQTGRGRRAKNAAIQSLTTSQAKPLRKSGGGAGRGGKGKGKTATGTGRGRPRKNTALTDSQSGSEGQLSELSDSSGPLRASSEISNDSPNREGSGSDLTPIQEEKSPSENFDSPFEGIPVVAEGPEPMEVS